MLKVGTAIAELHFLWHADAAFHILLKSAHVDVVAPVELVPLNVEQSGSHQFGHHKALVELAAFQNLVEKRLRNHFAGAVMAGVVAQNLGLIGPVLIDL